MERIVSLYICPSSCCGWHYNYMDLHITDTVFLFFETRQISQSTKIYDRTGTVLLYDVNAGSKRTVVPLSAISPYIQDATLAIEDANFYNHGGIDVKSIFRALLADPAQAESKKAPLR